MGTTIRYCLLILTTLVGFMSPAQPQADFTSPSSVCKDQFFELNNLSTGGTLYEWDFCTNDMDEAAILSSSLASVPRLSNNYGFDLVFDGTDWYGFATDLTNNNIWRFEYGDSPLNTPTVDSLGNPDDVLQTPEGISFIKDGANWYAFVGYSTNGGHFSRLDFGNSLSNDPDGVDIGNFGFTGQSRDVIPVIQGTDRILVFPYYNGNSLATVNYGNSFDNTPEAGDVTTNSITGSTLPRGIAITQRSGDWIVMVVSFNSKLHQLNLGSDITGSITIERELTNGDFGFIQPHRIDMVYSGSQHFAFISNTTNDPLILNFKDLETSSTITEIDNTGMPNFLGIHAVKSDGSVVLQGVVSGALQSLEYTASCSAINQNFSSELDPGELKIETEGDYVIELITRNEDSVSVHTDTVTVLNQTAPSISFTTDNACVSVQNTFTPTPADLDTYSWDFESDETEDSTDPTPTHQFPRDSTYAVRLDVTEGSCSNFATDTITIYPDPPTPSFSTETSLYCVGNDIQVSNDTDTAGYGDILSYSWTVTDYPSALMEDSVLLNFSSSGTKSISVTSSLPGCTSSPAQTDITVRDAPEASFSVEDNCFGEVTSYDNSSETGLDYEWTFGDGYQSSLASPTHEYEDAGDYTTTLVVTDDIGCTTTVQNTLTVYPIPEVGFQHALICRNDSIVFQDTSSVENGDLLSWSWYVDSVLTSSAKNPTLVFNQAGEFTIQQVVGAEGECSSSIERTVSVLELPDVDFEIQGNCIGENYQFINTSDPETYLSMEWTYQDETYEEDSLNFTLAEAGEYEVTMTTSNQFLCVNTLTRTFVVNDPPNMDIVVEGLCANDFTELTESIAISNDEVISRTWSYDQVTLGNGPKILHSFGESGTKNIRLSIETELGCEYDYTETIGILNPPTSSFTTSSDYAVAGNSVEVYDLSGYDSLLWYLEDDLFSVNDTFTTRLNEEGIFQISQIVTAENGCSDTTSTEILVAVPVVDLGLLELELEDDGSGFGTLLTVVENQSNLPIEEMTFTLDIDNRLPIREVNRSRINVGSSNVIRLNTSLPLDPSYLGTLCVTVSTSLGSGDENPYNNEVCLSQSEPVVFEPAYPNPASEEFFVRIITQEDENVIIRLLDPAGKVKKEQSFENLGSGLKTFLVDVRDFRPGMYFLEIQVGSNVNSSRILIK